MKHIKTWSERCEEHPDHQHGMISKSMIQARMQEEIDELRQALDTEQEPVAHVDHRIHGWPDCLVIKADPPDREDIIRMAREAGFEVYETDVWITDGWWLEELERFAALVAAEKEKQIIDMLERLQERNESHNYYAYAINIIRARSKQ